MKHSVAPLQISGMASVFTLKEKEEEVLHCVRSDIGREVRVSIEVLASLSFKFEFRHCVRGYDISAVRIVVKVKFWDIFFPGITVTKFWGEMVISPQVFTVLLMLVGTSCATMKLSEF